MGTVCQHMMRGTRVTIRRCHITGPLSEALRLRGSKKNYPNAGVNLGSEGNAYSACFIPAPRWVKEGAFAINAVRLPCPKMKRSRTRWKE